MILAADEIGGIGFKNGLPWPKLKEDLHWFKQLTEENVVVMGSNTWKSLGVHAPLKHRHNYVISSTHSKDDFPDCFAVRNPKIDSISLGVFGVIPHLGQGFSNFLASMLFLRS